MQLLHVGRRPQHVETVSLYYSSDIHGSTRLWKKFLKAGEFYKVDAAIMGGDLTGKAIIPVVRQPDSSYVARFLGESRTATTPAERDELLEAIRFNGLYPWVTDTDEVRKYGEDTSLQGMLFDRIIESEVRQWVAVADERLSGLTTKVFVMAGNDDPWAVDVALKPSQRMTSTAAFARWPSSSRIPLGRSSTSTSRRTPAASTTRSRSTSAWRSSCVAAPRTRCRSGVLRSGRSSRNTNHCCRSTATFTNPGARPGLGEPWR
jgi:hypothetical protein